MEGVRHTRYGWWLAQPGPVEATASLGTLVTDDRASTRQPDRLMAMRSSGTTMTYLSYQARS